MISAQKEIEQNATPFLRWAGGKAWFLPNLYRILADVKFQNYHEPFLGSGAAFFSLRGYHKSFLSDVNSDLILTYKAVMDYPANVYDALRQMKNTKEDYYRIRKRKCRTPITKAAQFIYLNQTSYNGLYRVNSIGEYNVPYGFRKNWQYKRVRLEQASEFLKQQDATLIQQDFEEALADVKCGDLVFLDPPYTVSSQNRKVLRGI